jgi:periplasmic nitrate reductase NapD
MSILGAVLRTHPDRLAPVVARLVGMPGVDISLNPGDGRIVLVMEDVECNGAIHSAAAALADMAMWPDVLGTSLVYEYSGPDAPALGERDMSDYRAWREKPGLNAANPSRPIDSATPTDDTDEFPTAFSAIPSASTAVSAPESEYANPVPPCTDRENLL